MLHNKIIIEKVVPFLDKQTQFYLRQIGKQQQQVIKEQQRGPFTTKVEFTLAVSGIFRDVKYLRLAWTNYSRTINGSRMPAYLYKLAHLGYFSIQALTSDRVAQMDGRVYCPYDEHIMDVNAIWVLAQLHQQRPFLLLSGLDDSVIKRRNNSNVYSAFAKEIALAIEAGYTATITNNELMLIPPAYDQYHLNPSNITLTELQIELAMNVVQPVQDEINMTRVKHLIDDDSDYENDLEPTGFEDLSDIDVEAAITYADEILNEPQNSTSNRDKSKAQQLANQIFTTFGDIALNDIEELETARPYLHQSLKTFESNLFDSCDDKDNILAVFVTSLLTLHKYNPNILPTKFVNALEESNPQNIFIALEEGLQEKITDTIQNLALEAKNSANFGIY